MDLSKYLSGGEPPVTEEQPRMSKEEYAALKKQEREEVWAEIDAKAQDVFKDGDSLKGFLDFMAQCKPQKTPNLLLLYSQNPEIRQVMTFEKVKEEGYSLRAGVHGYRFLVTQDYGNAHGSAFDKPGCADPYCGQSAGGSAGAVYPKTAYHLCEEWHE